MQSDRNIVPYIFNELKKLFSFGIKGTNGHWLIGACLLSSLACSDGDRELIYSCFRFDFDQIIISHEIRLNQGVGRQNFTKTLPVRPRSRFPIVKMTHIHSGSHDVLKSGPQRLQRALNFVDNEMGLGGRITPAN